MCRLRLQGTATAVLLLHILSSCAATEESGGTGGCSDSESCPWPESRAAPGGRAMSTDPAPSVVVRRAEVAEMMELWRDKGSGARMDLSTWKPTSLLSEGMNFSALGSYTIPGYNVEDALGSYSAYIAFPLTIDALAPPVSFTKIWTDKRSRAKDDGSAWMMNCPFGFVSLGDVWTKGYDEPEVDNYMCVNKNCAELCPYRELPAIVWSDKGSGAKEDVVVAVGDVPFGELRYNHDALGTSFVCKGKTLSDSCRERMMCLMKSCRKRAMIDKVIVESYDLRNPLPKKGSFHYADEAVIENMTPEPASRSGTLSWLQSSAVSMSLTTRVLSGVTYNNKAKIMGGIPFLEKAGVEIETTLEFELELSGSKTTQETKSQTIEVGFEVVAPPHSNLTAKAMVQKTDDVTIPFTVRLRVTALDFETVSAVTNKDLVEQLLKSQGFEGKVIEWNQARNYLVVEADGEMTGAFYISTLIDITCQSLDPENCLPMDEGLYKKIHAPAPLPDYAKPPKDVRVIDTEAEEEAIVSKCTPPNPEWSLRVDGDKCINDYQCLRNNCDGGKCRKPKFLAIGEDGLLYKRASLDDAIGWVRYGLRGKQFLSVTHMADGIVLAVGIDNNVYKLCEDARGWTQITSDGKVKSITMHPESGSFVGLGAKDGLLYTLPKAPTPGSTWTRSDETISVTALAVGARGALCFFADGQLKAIFGPNQPVLPVDRDRDTIIALSGHVVGTSIKYYGIKQDKQLYSRDSCEPGSRGVTWSSAGFVKTGPIISFSASI